jgi:hypothetical protein
MSPRDRRRKGGKSNVSRRTQALRGSTGLTETQEEKINAHLKQLARDKHGEDWSEITADDRAALCRKVAAAMRKDGKPVTTDQVRMVAQRMRSTPDVRSGYPVDLPFVEYAFIAHRAETTGETMKATLAAIVRGHREQQQPA